MLILDTVSGRKLDLDDPQPDQICLEDLASALSKVCRFGAQSLECYSVAQHAVHVSRMVEDAGRPDLALAALHHDSHEAYVCDLPKPVKDKLEAADNFAYKQVADALDAVIAEALGVTLSTKSSADGQVVKRAENRALLIEARRLLHRPASSAASASRSASRFSRSRSEASSTPMFLATSRRRRLGHGRLRRRPVRPMRSRSTQTA